jgi:predicted RNA-binding Zn-ribbon protein involved in translation (DUF1610 family)
MTVEAQDILCGGCKVAVQGPTEATPDDVFACPTCGQSDTRENVLAEANAFLIELAQRKLNEEMKKAASGSKFIQFKAAPVPTRTYRFITDHKF